ncbi:MAG: amidohydrolase family protein [Verrucomicrobia bacterium]|nr:amidohydrolase family protein [Verrucomicrobiota bacterium]
MNIRIALSLTGLLAALALHASTALPAKRPAGPVLLRGGEVHPVIGAVLPKADVLLMDGKIARIGPKLSAPAGAEVVDVTGQRIYPGFIIANTTLGLEEIGAVRASVDSSEYGPINPNVRAQAAFNPDSEMIPVARVNGVLTACATPVAANEGQPVPGLLAGTSSLMRLDGWTWEEMTLRPTVGLQLFWPAPVPAQRGPAPAPGALEETRKRYADQVKLIRQAFANARAYLRAKDAAGGHPAETDLRWEAMLPALRGEQPVFIHADDIKQIAAVLDWAREEPGLKLVLVGGRDAWRAADRLKAANIPVIIDGTTPLPARRDDGYDAVYANAGKLHAAGVKFCISESTNESGGPTNARNLPYEAAMAASYGLPADEALKAITIYPAEILGVAAELGSIEVGKRATLIVTDGDPLEIPTQVKQAYIDGARIDLRTRQTDLYDKYRQR